MKDEIMVSVIMLAYNSERHIAQALRSVLAQKTDFAFEILIGNDASTDDTAKIIGAMLPQAQGRVRLFQREENIGAAGNAFDLLMKSRGKYLAFCEGDDYWLSEHKLQQQVDFLEQHEDYIGCSHRCLLVDGEGRALRRQHLSWVKYKKRFTFRDFSGGRFLPGQTGTIVKRNLFRDSGEDWSILYSVNRNISDRLATEVYLLRGDFYFFDELWSAYRLKSEHGGRNLTSRMFKDNAHKCEDELRMNEAMETYAAEYLGRPVRFTKKRSEICLDSMIEAFRYRDPAHRSFSRSMLRGCTFAELALLPAALARKIINRFR